MGTNLVMEKSWKMGKNKVMEIENILTAVIWPMEAFGLCSRFQIVMLGRWKTIFSTPYFQFEKRCDFLFVYAMNTRR